MKLVKLARRLETRASKGPVQLTLSPAEARRLVAEIRFAEARRLQLAGANRELERIRSIILRFHRRRPRAGQAEAFKAIEEIQPSTRGEKFPGGYNLLEMLANYASLTDPKGQGTIIDGAAWDAGLGSDAVRLVRSAPLNGPEAVAKLAAFYRLKPSTMRKNLWAAKKIAKTLHALEPKDKHLASLLSAKLPRA